MNNRGSSAILCLCKSGHKGEVCRLMWHEPDDFCTASCMLGSLTLAADAKPLRPFPMCSGRVSAHTRRMRAAPSWATIFCANDCDSSCSAPCRHMVRVSKETKSPTGSELPPPPCKGKMTRTPQGLPFGWLLKVVLGTICLPAVTRRITLLTQSAVANIHARCNTMALVPAGTRANKDRPVMCTCKLWSRLLSSNSPICFLHNMFVLSRLQQD